jgi:hypothetical protein
MMSFSREKVQWKLLLLPMPLLLPAHDRPPLLLLLLSQQQLMLSRTLQITALLLGASANQSLAAKALTSRIPIAQPRTSRV